MKTRSTILYIICFLVVMFSTQCRQEDKFYSNVLRSDVFYQLYSDEAYDFLWVMDNSGSMKPRRDFVRDNLQNFLNVLTSRKAIDFQMAVVDTDMFSHNGALVKNPAGLEVVKSAESSNPVGDFASIINNVVDSPTSFWEQGLESAYQAIYQHKSKFSRVGIPLIIIFLTDEEDYSCQANCFGVEPEHNSDWIAFATSRYYNYFVNVKKAENTEVHIFPIVGVPSGACTVASLGTRYIEVQTQASDDGGMGVSASICNTELAASYQNIAKIISDRGVRFPLSDKASGTGINVYVNQVLIPYSPDNYIYDEETNSIIFTGAIPEKGSIIEVTYARSTE